MENLIIAFGVAFIVEIVHAIEEDYFGFKKDSGGSNFTGMTFFGLFEKMPKAHMALRLHKIHMVLIVLLIWIAMINYKVIVIIFFFYWGYQVIHHGFDLLKSMLMKTGYVPGFYTFWLYILPVIYLAKWWLK